MSEKIRYINAAQYDEEVKQADRVVVDFYSTECPPCEALASKYEGLAELYGDDVKFIKIFRQENRDLAESLGVTSSPTVLFYENGEQVGDTLRGGIKRADLIRNLDALLPEQRTAQIKEGIKPVHTTCDVLIIGGGPAGLTAGIYSAQAMLDTILVDVALPGGWVTTTHQVSNYPGYVDPIQGFMLSHNMTEHAKAAGVKFRPAVDVTRVDLESREIEVDGFETISAERIVIATGSSPRPIGVKGEKEYRGKGISYCATCDAKYYQDRDVIVIGGGNSAIEESLFISRFARKITIVHQFDHLQANKMLQEKAFASEKIEFVWEHEPREFVKNGAAVNEVVVEDLKTGELKRMGCDGVFIFAGTQPNLELFNGDFELDSWGYIETDEDMRTNVPNVFVVGDIRSKKYRQITTAVSDGTIAAMAIAKELETSTQPVKLETAKHPVT
jgi:thioredoxin reductase (NADPH)